MYWNLTNTGSILYIIAVLTFELSNMSSARHNQITELLSKLVNYNTNHNRISDLPS